MAGNSQRRGAMRKPGTKKGAVVGTGGQSRRAVKGRGPTPPAEIRKGHPAARKAAAAAKRDAQPGTTAARPSGQGQGRTAGDGGRSQPRGRGAAGRYPGDRAVCRGRAGLATNGSPRRVTFAAEKRISLLEVSRPELDRLTGNAIHQGLALVVPPYQYAHPEDLLARAKDSGRAPLIVAVDGVTDPRNLGAIVRSAAAFGAHGVVVPERRSAGMTASAWRTSAGTAARIRVARCTNLVRTLKDYAAKGLMIAGLDADGTTDTDSFELATSPLVIVVGSEGRGLARLTLTVCDVTVSIPMVRSVESLNASVAAGVVLAEVARRRRVESAG